MFEPATAGAVLVGRIIAVAVLAGAAVSEGSDVLDGRGVSDGIGVTDGNGVTVSVGNMAEVGISPAWREDGLAEAAAKQQQQQKTVIAGMIGIANLVPETLKRTDCPRKRLSAITQSYPASSTEPLRIIKRQ